MHESFKRRSAEDLLKMITKLQQGTLTIYIGPVSGSGKTYHMLREGNALRQQGIDVVICAVSTMQRPETVEQLGELERIPSIHWCRQRWHGDEGSQYSCSAGAQSGSGAR